MTNIPKSLKIQREIMESSQALNNYLKDFGEWVNEMNSKDKMVTQLKSSEPKNQYASPSTVESNIPTTKTKDPKIEKLKRDKNSIKDYYDNWDKINPDEDLVDVETGIGINSTDTAASLYNDKKKSNPNQNIGISITNSRGELNNNVNYQIEKIKREANGNFVIKNYNKSIELYSTGIKMLGPSDKSILSVNLHNNRGNCHIKLRNYKIGIKDFDFVLEIDPNNIKALYRRGICYIGIEQHNLAFDDLNKAFMLSNQEKEKEMIKAEIDRAISNMNSVILSQRASMERFNFKDEEHFRKMNIIDLINDSIIKDDDELFSSKQERQEENKEKSQPNNTGTQTNAIKTNQKIQKIVEQNKSILKKEEISKFVYDITTQNLTASSFKYAFRNFGSDITAKKDYLLKIDPNYFSKIFKTDLDKDTFLDIVKCLKLVENHKQVVEYLKGIMKINRIKLIIQLVPKKNKEEIFELFDILEKGNYSSDVIPIKDFFIN